MLLISYSPDSSLVLLYTLPARTLVDDDLLNPFVSRPFPETCHEQDFGLDVLCRAKPVASVYDPDVDFGCDPAFALLFLLGDIVNTRFESRKVATTFGLPSSP